MFARRHLGLGDRVAGRLVHELRGGGLRQRADRGGMGLQEGVEAGDHFVAGAGGAGWRRGEPRCGYHETRFEA